MTNTPLNESYSPLLTQFGIRRGIYGEIIPPPFYYGVHPTEAVDELALAVKRSTGDDLARPKKGRSKAGLDRLAALYVHQQRITQALSGELVDPIATALRILVEDAHEPMSLRPVFLDEIYHLSFVPILQKTDDDESWRVGVKGQGKTAQFKAASIAEAYATAQQLYNLWVDDEAKTWKAQMKKMVQAMTPDVHTLFWEISLGQRNSAVITPEYTLERWGGHGQYALQLPNSQYFAFTAHGFHQAAMYVRAMMNQKQGVQLPPISAETLQDALSAILPDIHQSGQNSFVCGESVAEVTPPRTTLYLYRRNLTELDKIGYIQIRKGVLELHQKKGSNKSPKLAHSLILPAEWSDTARMKISIMWAFFCLL